MGREGALGPAGCNAILRLTTLSEQRLRRGSAVPTRPPSLQTAATSLRVPRPHILLTNWLNIWGFPQPLSGLMIH